MWAIGGRLVKYQVNMVFSFCCLLFLSSVERKLYH